MLTYAEVRQVIRQQLIEASKRYCNQATQANRTAVLHAMGAIDVLNTTEVHLHWASYATHLADVDEDNWTFALITASEWSE